MRILHINCNYILTSLHQLMIENLDILGYQNTVFAPTYNKELSIITPKSNVLVCECFKKWNRIIFDYKQSKIYRSIQNNIHINTYNLIHAYTLFTDGNCARRISKKYNIPYVVAVRNTDVNDFFRMMPHLRIRGVQIMRDASAIFFLSETYRKRVFDKYIPEKYHLEIEKKTYIIPNGIDDFWISNSPINEKFIGNDIKLIFAGRIDKNKNIPTTQKAMEILRKKGYKISLTVVGKVVNKKEFSLIKNDKYTTYISEKPKEELIQLYRKHDIFVMPSYTESFGLVYAEAMSQGLPVVYSAGQGFDSQFTEGQVGYHVNSHSSESVANAIIKIIDNYQELSRTVTKYARKFMWNTIVQQYDEIYNKIGIDKCKTS